MGVPGFGLRTIRGQIMAIVVFAIALVVAISRVFDSSDFVFAADVDVIGQRAYTLSMLLRDADAEERSRILARASEAGMDAVVANRAEVDTLPLPQDFESRVGRVLTYLFPPDTELPPGAQMIQLDTGRAFAVPIDEREVLLYRSVPDTMLTTDLTSPILYFTLSFAILLLLFSVFAVRAITAPLRSIAGKLRDTEVFLAQTRPLEEGGSVELVDLTRALNEMRDRVRGMIDNRTRMLRSVSHDLRTPLTRMRMRAERIEDETVRSQLLSDVAQVNAMIDATLDFLRDDRRTERPARADLASIMQTISSDFLDVGRAVTYRGPARLILSCKPSALSRAITNLCENGLKFGTEVTMVLHADGASVRIDVLDDGPGIPAQFRRQVLEPFFKIDQARKQGGQQAGFGLGLSIVDEIVRDHGGTLTLADNTPRGLRATITLPTRQGPDPVQNSDRTGRSSAV